MYNCSLLKVKKYKNLQSFNIDYIDTIFNSNLLTVYECKCPKCNQIYVSWVYEVYSPTHDEDYWSFWVPVNKDELEQIKKDAKLIIDITRGRIHVMQINNSELYIDSDKNFAFDVYLNMFGYSDYIAKEDDEYE